ncbi:RAP protein, putative [Plasmodium malariae]|uniref:RAP protein, putative n=1 Tax=Plasmodium malariae TaxID=5858 RepID=A0A1A8WM58_PLAMA|nr:RAP protein, putative [Plasmodium malariae]
MYSLCFHHCATESVKNLSCVMYQVKIVIKKKIGVQFSSSNTRYRKITVIPFDRNELKLHYKNIPFDIEDLDKKSKSEILHIYKIIRNQDELNKLPSDFVDNLFECTRKFVRCFLPYEFIKIYKTLNIIKKKDKVLNLLLHQQIKRIYKSFDITSISKLFQIYIFTKSKPIYLIKKLTENFLNSNINECKPWNIREIISIFSYFNIHSKEHIDKIYKKCIPVIAENIRAYTPKDCTIIFYSCVKMNRQGNILTNAVAKNVILKIKNYEFHQLAIILNCFSKIGEKNNKLCKIICDKIKEKMKLQRNSTYSTNLVNLTGLTNFQICDYTADGVKNYEEVRKNGTVMGSVSLKEDEAIIGSSLVKCVDRSSDSLCHSGVTEIGNEDKVEKEEQVPHLGKNKNVQKIVEKKKKNNNFEMKNNQMTNIEQGQILKPKDVSIILNSLIKLEYYDNETFNCLIPFIINNVSKFSVQSLSNLVYSFSKIQINNNLMLDKIINESAMKIQKFKNIEMSNLANSLVRLNRKDKTLFTYIIDEFLYRATIGTKFKNYKFDVLSLQQLAYSFSRVGLQDHKVYIVLYRLLVRRVNESKKEAEKEAKMEVKMGGTIMPKRKIAENALVPQSTTEGVQKKWSYKLTSCSTSTIRSVIQGRKESKEAVIKTQRQVQAQKNASRENHFDFFCLSSFVHSYGKARIQYKQFSHFISYIIRKKKRNNEIVSNESLTNLIYGLVKLQFKDKKVYKLLLKECTERIDTIKTFQIILLFYSFSKLKMYSYKFVKKSLQTLSRNIHHLSLSDLSLTCYSLSNFLYRDIIFLFKAHKMVLLNNSNDINKTHVCQLFNSFTKLCFYHKPFYDFIFQKIISFIHEFNEKELTNIVFSFIYYFHMNKLYLDQEQEKKVAHVGESSTGSITMVRYSKDSTDDDKHQDDCADDGNASKMGCIKMEGAKMEGVKLLGARLPEGRSENFCLTGQGKNNAKIMNVHAILKNSISNYKVNGEPIERKNKKEDNSIKEEILEERFKNELNLFFNLVYILSEKYRQKISLISIYQLQIVDLYLRAFFSNYFKFPIYLKVFFLKCRNVKFKIDDYIILSSKTHRNISRYFNLVGIKHRSEVQFGPFQLDIVVDFLQHNKAYTYNNISFDEETNTSNGGKMNLFCESKRGEKQADIDNGKVQYNQQGGIYNDRAQRNQVAVKLLNKKILIEVDGIAHFYKESYSRTMNSIIKDFILKKFGWYIIHIPYQEWNQCFNFKKKLQYSVQILKHILDVDRGDTNVKGGLNVVINKNDVQRGGKEELQGKQDEYSDEACQESHSTKLIHKRALNRNIYEEMGNNQNEKHINTPGTTMDEANEKSLPDFYTISEEAIFFNQIKNRNKHQQDIMKRLRHSTKLQYNYNISCRTDLSSKKDQTENSTSNLLSTGVDQGSTYDQDGKI